MHLIETYSLASSSKIDKPFILDKFFPLAIDKYITFQPYSKYSSKNYDFWFEVINIIKPALDKEGISIVQIGGMNEKAIQGCYHTQGQTNFGQAAFLIKNGLMHFGSDSFGVHLASAFNKKIVALYSNNFINCVKPYWGKSSDHILLEPDRDNGNKPNFSAEENPKTINTIRPELIAESILKLLDIKFTFPYETVFIGSYYNFAKLVEMVPDVAINTQSLNIDSIIVRMDFHHNEEILIHQLNISPVSIVTNKPIKVDIIESFKSRIKQLIYIVEKENSPEFAEKMKFLGLPFSMMTELPDEELNKFKLDYLDIGMIAKKDKINPDNLDNFRGIDRSKLYYKTNKITLAQKQIYPSRSAWGSNQNIPTVHPEFLPIINDDYFWSELDYFLIAKLKD